jgi:hypothetical protein
MARTARLSNRNILIFGLLLCILGAVVVAWLLGALDLAGLLGRQAPASRD